MPVRLLLTLIIASLTIACGPAQAPLQTADAPDLVILNGRVLTMDDKGTTPRYCTRPSCAGCEFAHETREERVKRMGFKDFEEYARSLFEFLKKGL